MESDSVSNLLTPRAAIDEVFNSKVEAAKATETLNLLELTPENMDKYASHVKWLLSEGQGESLYNIGGPGNSGDEVGLSEENLQKGIQNLMEVAKKINAAVSVICERNGKTGRVADLLIRQIDEDSYIDVRYAVCGNVDSGKSTMVGVLTRAQLDNGRGLVRVNCFAHKHEVTSGRTSSISQQIMGFNEQGECVNQLLLESTGGHPYGWGDIIEQSHKVISFIDLAGHEKYLKTTVSGMTGHMPDYCLLLIGANMGVTRMTKEHLGIALALKIPVVVVITKIDMCPENVLKQTLTDIQKILKIRGVRKISLVVRNSDDLITAIKTLDNDRVVPIFLVSNVTGENLEMFRKFLNVVPPRIQWDLLREKAPEVLIDQTYFVTGVGTVVGGTVMAGRVVAGQTLLLGPDGNGLFVPVQIKSIHSKRVPVKQVIAGQSVGFALKKIKRSMIRKGMVLVDPSEKPQAIWNFEADVIVLYHSTTIHTNYQPVVQCMTMRQSARIIKIIDRDVLRTGDRATVRFRFLYHPEYLKIGMRIIFREGRCKGIGIISKVQDVEEEEKEKTDKVDKPLTTSTTKTEKPTTTTTKIEKPTATSKVEKPTTTTAKVEKPTTTAKVEKPTTTTTKVEKPPTATTKIEKTTTSTAKVEKPPPTKKV